MLSNFKRVMILAGICAVCVVFGGCMEGKAKKKSAKAAKETAAIDSGYDFGGFNLAGKWYRGNMHLHTTISDGKMAPVETAEYYRKGGYDFVAITDHVTQYMKKKASYPLAEMNKKDFLVMPGMEYIKIKGDDIMHVVVVGEEYKNEWRDDESLSDAMKKWWDGGSFTFYAHPYWSLNSTQLVEDINFLPALEVYNNVTGKDGNRRSNSALYWDRVLKKGRRVLGVANDDCHTPSLHAFGGWVMVKAERLDKESILNALRSGEFYFSTGPRIEELYYDTAGKVHVRCSPVESIRIVSVTSGSAMVAAKPGKTITEAVIPWNKKVPFWRVECSDAQGRTAWSQPIVGKP